MATENGKSDMFEVSGPMVADGSMFVALRLHPSPDAPLRSPQGITAFLTINAMRGNAPPDQRHRLALTPEDAIKVGAPASGAQIRIAEIQGVSKTSWTFPVLCAIASKEVSVLAIDTLRGVFHIDGPGGYWSWKVKRD